MDITSLQAFLAVADYQSFSKAAEKLHITQPAVSKRVASLEAELGTALFNRIGRNTALTEAGKEVRLKAQDIVSRAEDLSRYASNFSGGVSGALAIAIAHHIGLYRMPPILKDFHRQFDEVDLDIHFEDSEQALRLVEQGDIEFAIITLPRRLPKLLEGRRLWHDPLSCVVGADHPLSSRTSLPFKELLGYSCVLTDAETETHQVLLREIRTQKQQISVQMTTNNLQTLKMLVATGVGWSVLPTTMLDETLVPLEVGLSLSRDLGVVFHRKRTFSNAANAFLATLDKYIA